MLNQFAEAVADFTRVLEMLPESSRVLVKRGEAYNELGETDPALGWVEVAAVDDASVFVQQDRDAKPIGSNVIGQSL